MSHLPGPLAQLAEQRTFNPRVVGSIPTGPTRPAEALRRLPASPHHPGRPLINRGAGRGDARRESHLVGFPGSVGLPFTAPDMPLRYDVSSGPTTIEVSTLALLRVAPDCTHGVDVTVAPAAQGQVVSRATADDGRTAGMFIRVKGPQVRLTITRPDGSKYDVMIANHEVAPATPTWQVRAAG